MHAIDEEQLQQQVDDFLESRPGGERLLAFLSLPSILAGISYAAIEHAVLGRTRDVVFIALLCAATLFLSLAILYLRRLLTRSAVLLYRGAAMYPDARSTRLGWRATWKYGAVGPGELLKFVFDRRAMGLCALTYGAALAMAPVILGVHSSNPTLLVALMIFMFCANAVTGASFYSLIMLLKQSWHLAKRLDVRLFERRTDPVRSYSSLLARISIMAAGYIGLCQTSVIFSHFSGPWIYGYAVFGFIVFVAIYYVPQMPILIKLRNERDQALAILDFERMEIFSRPVNSASLDALYKLGEVETQIVRMGTGLSPTDAWRVTVAGLGSLLAPFVLGLVKSLLPYFPRFQDFRLFD
jgi:hypothetical protein